MMIDSAEFVADITGCAAWATWDDGVIVIWTDRPPQFYTREKNGKWSGEAIDPPPGSMTTVMTDSGRVVWKGSEI